MARPKGSKNKKLSKDYYPEYTAETIKAAMYEIKRLMNSQEVSDEQKLRVQKIWERMVRIIESSPKKKVQE